MEEIRNDTIPASFGEHLPRRSSRIFFTGFLFCFTVVAACQLDNGSIFLEARRGGGGREEEGMPGKLPGSRRISIPLPFPSFFQAGRYRDESKTSPVNSRPQDPRTRPFGRDKILPRYKISGWAASPLPLPLSLSLPLSPFLPLPPPRCTWLQAGRTSWTRR